MGQTPGVSFLSQPWAKAGDTKQRWQPALLVPGVPQKIVPVVGGMGVPELCGAARAWRKEMFHGPGHKLPSRGAGPPLLPSEHSLARPVNGTELVL